MWLLLCSGPYSCCCCSSRFEDGEKSSERVVHVILFNIEGEQHKCKEGGANTSRLAQNDTFSTFIGLDRCANDDHAQRLRRVEVVAAPSFLLLCDFQLAIWSLHKSRWPNRFFNPWQRYEILKEHSKRKHGKEVLTACPVCRK